jgi:DNA-directed RNA polymerase specialized sigma24 family protein
VLDKTITERSHRWLGILYWDLLEERFKTGTSTPLADVRDKTVDEYAERLYEALVPALYQYFSNRFAAQIKELFQRAGGTKQLISPYLSGVALLTQKQGRSQIRLIDVIPEEFWLGFITTYLELNFGIPLFNDLLPQVRTVCEEITEQAARDILNLIITLVKGQEGEAFLKRYLCRENEAIVRYSKSRLFGEGNTERAIGILWDCGLNYGLNLSWQEVTKPHTEGDRLHQNDRIHNRLVRLTTTLDDYIAKNDIISLFNKGSTGKLTRIVSKAIKNDFIDLKRRFNAQKRHGVEIPISQLLNKSTHGKDSHDYSSADEQLTEIADRFSDRESDFAKIENRIDLKRLSGSAKLSKREKQALLLEIESVLQQGERLTFDQLGDRMKVSKGSAREYFGRACRKLRAAR